VGQGPLGSHRGALNDHADRHSGRRDSGSLDRAIQWLAIGLTAALLAVVMLGVITRALNDPLILDR